MRTRRYTGNGLDTKSNGEGITKLVSLCRRRWGAQSLGTYAPRDKRGKPGNLSVHALFRAADVKFKSRKQTIQACKWFAKYNHELNIDLIVDYSYRGLNRKSYGRIWSCERQRWRKLKKGEVAGGGQAWASFLHIELGFGSLSEDKAKFESAWRSLPKPKPVIKN